MRRESPGETPAPIRLEARWPIMAAVVVMLTITLLRPTELRIAPVWILPAFEVVLLAFLVASHPALLTRRASRLRALSIAVVAIVLVDTLAATVRLVDVLIHGGHATNSADQLLAAGALVWGCNVIAFALLYWLIDGGGAAVRAHHPRTYPDLAFPQQLSPEIAPAGWRPQFLDYFYLSLTSSAAFSPTDVMPLVPWAKIAMAAQSLISIAVLGLVIARAVNVFT
jgi:uncharacterized membrane protein